MTRPHSHFGVRGLLLLAALALGLSSLSTRAAGLAWLLVLVAGIAAWLAREPQSPAAASAPGHLPAPALKAAQWWLLACLAAFVLMAIPTAHWGEPWPERHPQWRLLLGALGIWLLSRHGRFCALSWPALASGGAVALMSAWGLVVFSGADAAPTNRIPWMAGLSLLSCALLVLSYQLKNAPRGLRRWWWLASALTLSTVLLSGVRGSWGLLLVWPLAWRGLQRLDQGLWNWTPRRVVLLLLGLLLLTALGDQAIPDKDRLSTRLALIAQEAGIDKASPGLQANSSVGIRLVIYQAGLSQVTSQPSWLGLGQAEHKRFLRATVQAVAPEMVDVIGHYHNDWLNPWAEFGLFGLMGYLSLLVGMALVAWDTRREDALALKVGALSVLAMHLSTGMSNANFAHNYYPVLLSLAMGLMLIGERHAVIDLSGSRQQTTG